MLENGEDLDIFLPEVDTLQSRLDQLSWIKVSLKVYFLWIKFPSFNICFTNLMLLNIILAWVNFDDQNISL